MLGEHLVDGGQVPLIRCSCGVQIHVEDQALEQVSLAVIPEVISLAIPFGVGNNHIGQHLSHQSVAAQIKHTVPGIAPFWIEQIVDPDGVAALSEQLRCVGVHFRLWIRHNHRLTAPDALEDRWADHTSGLHSSAGTEYSDVLVEPRVLRQADDGALLCFSKDDPPGLCNTGHLQDRPHLLVAHPTGCAIGAPLAAGKVAGIIVLASEAILESEKEIQAAGQHRQKECAYQAVYGQGAAPAHQG